ncbi:MAG: glycosyltransferase family 4 protein [Candidatus Saccharimonas sp.]
MVINIVSPHASHYLGGMEVVTLQMARHLAADGTTVRFFTRQTAARSDIYEQLLSEVSDRLQVIEIPLPSDTPLPDGTWPTFYRIACDFGVAAQPYYRQFVDADLFITHLSADSLFLPPGVRNILHLHGSPHVADDLMGAAVNIPKTTIAHSQSIKNWWVTHYPMLTPRVFTNGIDTTYFSGDPQEDRPIDILYVGRFMEHKGVDDVLKAVHAGYTVAVAGNGLYLPELKDIARERGLLDSVTFYDTPSTETIKRLYRRAKIFACPSKGREGVLTTLLEAGASGCAVVTTSGSGMTDIIRDGINGVVITPSDVKALERAFDILLRDNDKRLELATNLQSEIRTHWSWKSKADELKVIYHEAL